MSKHSDYRKQQHGRDHNNQDQKEKENQLSGSWREHEAVDIEQGWADAFTPKVQSIIDTLKHEIEPLRRRLSLAEQRADKFKNLAAQHVFLDLLNRRETLNIIIHVFAHNAKFLMSPVLMLLHVANADDVRRKYGRRGLDQYLTEICMRVLKSNNESDIFGSICGNDFALLMLRENYALANQAADHLVVQVCDQPVEINSNSVSIQILTGIADLRYIHDGEAAINHADQNMF